MSKARGPYRVDPLRYKKANEALDKKAENARELGLDYEPVWNNLPSNKDVEDAMRLKRLSRLAEQPAPATELREQEPVTWRNAAIRVGEDLCSVGPFGYYDMTAEKWLDWALSVVTVHAPPAQRTWVSLTDEDIDYLCELAYENDEELILTVQAKIKEKNT